MHTIASLFMQITTEIVLEGRRYQYIVLPNGFSPAVRVFTNVLTPPLKYLRPKGHLPVKYIDESLLLGETFEICLKNMRATVVLLSELGFTIHPEKPVLVPTGLCKYDNNSD